MLNPLDIVESARRQCVRESGYGSYPVMFLSSVVFYVRNPDFLDFIAECRKEYGV